MVALGMTFRREKGVLLAFVGILAALPLPWNEPRPEGVVGLGALVFYAAALAFFAIRSLNGRDLSLPLWALNLAGLLYLPFFLYELRSLGSTQLTRPMVHLLMFGLVLKTYAMRHERDKWHIVFLIFFIFMTAMATSVHPAIVLYLVAFLVGMLVLLFRFVWLHTVSLFEAPSASPAVAFPQRRLIALTTLGTLLLAVPLFAALPRFRNSYLLAGGVRAAGNLGYRSGFRDQVDLDVVGNIRNSTEIALRFELDNERSFVPERFRGASYELFDGRGWRRTRYTKQLAAVGARYFQLAQTRRNAMMHIWLQPIGSRSLLLPTGAVSLEADGPFFVDAGGSVLFNQMPRQIFEYRVGFVERPVTRGRSDGGRDRASLDPTGISEAVAELALEVAGEGTSLERARRIERYLRENYEYTLDLLGRVSEAPIDDFLFRYRSGHCEYFASSMVLMLRSIGIPARLVTGFLGWELNPLEGFYIIRDSNAHAWVEGYVEPDGWVTFDPTPPDGLPTSADVDLGLLARQAWDYLEFRWDQYVIGFGFFDQLGLIARARSLIDLVRRPFVREKQPLRMPRGRDAPSDTGGVDATSRWEADWWPVALLVALAALALAFAVYRGRARGPSRLYAELRRIASHRGIRVRGSTPPLALGRSVADTWPDAAPAVGTVIDLYLRQSFAGETPAAKERRRAAQAWRQAKKLMR